MILISTNVQDMVWDLMEEELFLFRSGSFGQNLIIFGADISSSAHANNKIKIFWILMKVLHKD